MGQQAGVSYNSGARSIPEDHVVTVDPRLVLSDVPDPDARNFILEGLAESNRARVHEPQLRHLIVLVKQPETGRLRGGLWGRTAWNWLLIELLYVAPELRGNGWGRRLVQGAEEEAVR